MIKCAEGHWYCPHLAASQTYGEAPECCGKCGFDPQVDGEDEEVEEALDD